MVDPDSLPLSPTKKQLVFVDIAAGQAGAHNTGFLDALISYVDSAVADCLVVTHASLSNEWKERLSASGIKSLPLFQTYLYGQLPSYFEVPARAKYVYDLAHEYRDALSKIESLWPVGEIHLVFHTLTAIHIDALAHAVMRQQTSQRVSLHVFLMYPAGDDMVQRMEYKSALTKLQKAGVTLRLYASNQEYSIDYGQLLSSDALDMHPSFLGDWRVPAKPVRSGLHDKAKVLLFMGAMKKDKGLYDIPKLAKLLQVSLGQDLHFVVHLADKSKLISREGAAMWHALQPWLRSAQMTLIEGFIDTAAMMKMVSDADAMVLNYDATHYRDKTSGVLWLAAQFGLSCIVPAGTWMQREADRLGLQVAILQPSGELTLEAMPMLTEPRVQYRAQILQPFWQWLLSR